MRILIIAGISRSLVNFRGPLIRTMLAAGHEVIACAEEPEPDVADTLLDWGVRFTPLRLSRAGMSPLGDIRTCLQLRRLMCEQRPDAILAYTIKPVIWGGLAARSCGIRNVYSLITGLGYAFVNGQAFKQRLTGWVARRLYRFSLRFSHTVFFQNTDDRGVFTKLGLVSEEKTVVVSGSGVDIAHYGQTEESPDKQSPSMPHDARSLVFLLIARLLRDKGICEYALAAETIKRDYPQAEFHLVGYFDPNPTGLEKEELENWTKNGTIIYKGEQHDVRPFLRDCSVYVLPSYREGTPRTVLEAMAMGRPIITTDAPGCRETIRFQNKQSSNSHNSRLTFSPELRIGLNGILIPPRDPEALAEAMRFFIDHPEQIAIMGRESRKYAEERYDVHKVNAVMMRKMGIG